MHIYQRSIQPDANDSLSIIAGLVPGDREVLDVGTGSGALGCYLSERKGCRVDGLTYNAEEAERARVHYRRVEVLNLEHQLPSTCLGGQRYDVIVAADVLEHLRNADAVLEDLASLLRPGGFIVLSIPNVTHLGVVLGLLMRRFVRTREGLLDTTHTHFFDRESLRRLVDGAGLKVMGESAVVRNLVETEFAQIDASAFPPAVLDYVAADPDATIYQFIWTLAPQATVAEAPTPIEVPALPRINASPQYLAQVFFDFGEGLREEDSVHMLGTYRDGLQTLRRAIPGDAALIRALRIDFADRPGVFEFGGVRAVSAAGQPVWEWRGEWGPGVVFSDCELLPSTGLAGARLARSLSRDPSARIAVAPGALAGARQIELVQSPPQPYMDLAWGEAQRRLGQQMDGLVQANTLMAQTLEACRQEYAAAREVAKTQMQAIQVELLASHRALQGIHKSRSWRWTHGLRKLEARLAKLSRSVKKRTLPRPAPVVHPPAHCMVDRIAITDDVVYAEAWCALPGHAVRGVALALLGADGVEERLVGEHGLPRPDVAHHVPEYGPDTGVLVYQRRQRRGPVAGMRVVIDTPEGEVEFTLDTSLVQGACLLPPGQERPWLPILTAWLAQLKPGAVLVIDHDLGGGANFYREECIKAWAAEGREVLLWVFIPREQRHELQRINEAGTNRLAVDKRAWERLYQAPALAEVVFNNSVSYPEPEHVAEVLLEFKRHSSARVVFLVHDHQALCPSFSLLDDQGQYCGVPDPERCRACLPAHQGRFVKLVRTPSIDAWRGVWGACLLAVDEVVCFSECTRRLMLRAYPQLAQREIAVRPHRVDHVSGAYRVPPMSGTVRVAVVGEISPHKGSHVIAALLDEIARRGAPVEVHVLGALHGVAERPGLHLTGSYRRDELADRLGAAGVHMAIMPSILPETFSYVTHELIALGVPVVSFDLGAQADAVRRHPLGRLARRMDAAALLDEVLALARELPAMQAASTPEAVAP